ncbi:hypothetical protein TNCV_1076641 [Trichonephila clavipes]|uniref:Uncharacterized protein n=1 Tax=Trichonephila clavipes TaxID=2585209 RepID=A0A8X6V7G7_TRICX|nr:hypothetical protein TNCV_1076641 [Trichonephila clavipes]
MKSIPPGWKTKRNKVVTSPCHGDVVRHVGRRRQMTSIRQETVENLLKNETDFELPVLSMRAAKQFDLSNHTDNSAFFFLSLADCLVFREAGDERKSLRECAFHERPR